MSTNIAIILSSGAGKRMGAGKNKTLLKLGKKPVIFYALTVFEKCSEVEKIVLVVKEEEKEIFSRIIARNKLRKVSKIIFGGKERQDSAENGMNFIARNLSPEKNSVVLFHNGANPFVTEKEIREVIAEARKYGAAVVARKTKDTIRKVDKKKLSFGIVDREYLWNMQTPQAMRFFLARKAFNLAKKDKFFGTDDVALVERLGKKIKIVEASENNFKITTPIDLDLAKIILKKQRKND